jgi:hypothetical protein
MRPSIALLAAVLGLSVGSLGAQNVPNAASAIFALSVPNEKPFFLIGSYHPGTAR